jgi:hypothetical protein
MQSVNVTLFEMPECRNVRCPVGPVHGRNKTANGKTSPVRYWNKGTQSGTGMLQNQTDIPDARMPMPMPSPNNNKVINTENKYLLRN